MDKNILSQHQLNIFQTDGYFKINDFVPHPLLQKLRHFFEEEMKLDSDTEGKVVHTNGTENFVTNLDNICNKKNLCCLELLAYPPILQLANQICGNDFFMIQEFAVMKNLGDDLPVLWHLDMLHQRKGKCFTMGIYLDDAHEGDGALRIVPKSHLSNKTICELSKEASIEVAMKAGDILLHDMMLAHSSSPLIKNNIRRVIYFEFLTAAHIKAENIYTDELVQRRTRLLFAATAHYKRLHPTSEQFNLNKEDLFNDSDKSIETILEEVYAEPIKARPSTYCFE